MYMSFLYFTVSILSRGKVLHTHTYAHTVVYVNIRRKTQGDYLSFGHHLGSKKKKKIPGTLSFVNHHRKCTRLQVVDGGV